MRNEEKRKNEETFARNMSATGGCEVRGLGLRQY